MFMRGMVCAEVDGDASKAVTACVEVQACTNRAQSRRSVDYLLAGTSVVTNSHLARFAAAPYLQWLCSSPEFSPMLNRTSKQLRKEIIESYAVIEAIESALAAAHPFDDRPLPPSCIVDLCSGKGFLSVLLALEFPDTPVTMLDNNASIKTDHVVMLSNLHFRCADVMSSDISSELADVEIAASGGARIAVGMHLCGLLSPRAIELFGASDFLDWLVLVPCCLDKRTVRRCVACAPGVRCTALRARLANAVLRRVQYVVLPGLRYLAYASWFVLPGLRSLARDDCTSVLSCSAKERCSRALTCDTVCERRIRTSNHEQSCALSTLTSSR